MTVLLSWVAQLQGGAAAPAPAAGGPCGGGDWGYVTSDPLTAIHVRETGDDVTGDGSEALPFASIARAVDEARTRAYGDRFVAVGPGTFDANVLLDSVDDDSLVLQGCGPDETFLQGDDLSPVLDVAVNAEVGIGGFSLVEGKDTLTIRDGAIVEANALVVADTKDRGIVVDGLATMAWFEDVSVADVNEGGACGWGVDIRDALVLWFGGAVEDTKALGVFAEGADLLLDQVDVIDTSTHTDGTLGRGLHAQDSWTIVTSSTYEKNYDAAIYLLEPRGGVIGQIVIDQPGVGIIAPGGLPTTGDGIVVRGLADQRVVYLLDNTVEDAARTAVLLEDIRAVVGGNLGINTGLFPIYGAHAYKQGITALLGPDRPGVLDLSATPEPTNDAWITCP